MSNLSKVLLKGVSLALLCIVAIGCDESEQEVASFVPGPSFDSEGTSIAQGGGGVGTQPVLDVQPDKGISGPIGAPTNGPAGPPAAAPPIVAGDPVAVPTPTPTPTPLPTPTPTPFPFPTGSLACDTSNVINGAVLTLNATVPAGVATVSGITITNLTRGLQIPAEGAALTIESPVLDSANVLGRTELINVQFTVPFNTAIISDIGNGDTLVLSLTVTDSLGRILVLETLPCIASVDAGSLPRPPIPPGAVVLEQVDLTATGFELAQTGDTGVVGFGPLVGPGALSADFDGPGSTAFPDNGIMEQLCIGGTPFFRGSNRPVLLINEELGLFEEVNQGVLAPSSTLNTPITLAGQRLIIFIDGNGFLRLQISPSNFDELYRINFFEGRNLNFRIAECLDELSFSDSTALIEGVLDSTVSLFTLRGTVDGINEPDSTNLGSIEGAIFTSAEPLPLGLVDTEDPRFSGVINLLDVSNNQLRSDVSLVIDQVGAQQTQAALSDLSVSDGSVNPVSGNPPFISINGCSATATNNRVCGRFQINQPFAPTAGPDGDGINPDVLVISGTFEGLLETAPAE